MSGRILAAVAAATFSLGPVVANAALVTSAPAGGTVIDFSQFVGCNFAASGCAAADSPDVGGLVGESVIFSGTVGLFGASLYDAGFGLGFNGGWSSTRIGYAATNSETASMTFTFAAPVSSVGGFVNYSPGLGPNPILEVLGAGMVVLETYDVAVAAPISTGINSVDDGAFRGIERGANDIYALRWSNNFGVLDDLTFSRIAVNGAPEPGTLALLGLGLAGLAATRRRKQ